MLYLVIGVLAAMFTSSALIISGEWNEANDAELINEQEVDRWVEENDPEVEQIQDFGRPVYSSRYVEVYNYNGELVGIRYPQEANMGFFELVAMEGCCAIAFVSAIGFMWLIIRH